MADTKLVGHSTTPLLWHQLCGTCTSANMPFGDILPSMPRQALQLSLYNVFQPAFHNRAQASTCKICLIVEMFWKQNSIACCKNTAINYRRQLCWCFNCMFCVRVVVPPRPLLCPFALTLICLSVCVFVCLLPCSSSSPPWLHTPTQPPTHHTTPHIHPRAAYSADTTRLLSPLNSLPPTR